MNQISKKKGHTIYFILLYDTGKIRENMIMDIKDYNEKNELNASIYQDENVCDLYYVLYIGHR